MLAVPALHLHSLLLGPLNRRSNDTSSLKVRQRQRERFARRNNLMINSGARAISRGVRLLSDLTLPLLCCFEIWDRSDNASLETSLGQLRLRLRLSRSPRLSGEFPGQSRNYGWSEASMLPHKIYKQVNPLAGAAAALFFLPLSRSLGLPRSLFTHLTILLENNNNNRLLVGWLEYS